MKHKYEKAHEYEKKYDHHMKEGCENTILEKNTQI